jgi:mono/diheme cytochrome c family protein
MKREQRSFHPARLERRGVVAALLLLATLAQPAGPVLAADEPDELDQVPGLLASFGLTGNPEPISLRVVPDLAATWGKGSPDPRVPADRFNGRWTGSILIQSPGMHHFHARTDGTVVLRVAGRVVLDGKSENVLASAIDLPAGFSTLVLEYRHEGGPARVAIDWEGPSFGREPVPARVLYHTPAVTDRDDSFEVGRRLADRLGCANCHALLDLPRHPEIGPPLADAGRSIDPRWLEDWLIDPTRVRPRSGMPAFGPGLSANEAADLAAFLKNAAKPASVTSEVKMALNVARPEKGELLFRSVGCLGCHTREAGNEDRAAPNLSDLPGKRSETWVAAYLEHPKSSKLASRHRADLKLTADEAAHLAAYLVGTPERKDRPVPAQEGDPRRGAALADRLRCASCHTIPGLKPRPADLVLSSDSRPDAGCLADQPAREIPRFALTPPERTASRAFIAQLPRQPAPTSPETLAEDLIRRRNCLGCHIREGRGGTELGTRVAALIARDPALGGLKGTLTPPNLTAVGDKLRPEYLALALRGAAPTARPWLSVRMPSFTFEPGEADALAAYLQARDRMTESPDPSDDTPTHPDAPTLDRASRLIGQRGFGCISCHVLAGRIPPGGEPETLGPDLALAHRRMSRRYFERWIANPQRIIAGTPMPQFLVPVTTDPGPLPDQLATIWQLLGSPRVAEVAAFGTREILKREGDRAMVVRDMILVPEAPGTQYTPRGLSLGLKNDQSLLIDTDRLTWLAWWHRGFVSRTKAGRLWEWHPEGERLWTAPERLAPVVLLGPDDQSVPPREVRERLGTFDELDFDGPGIRLVYRLHAPESGFFQVEERIRPTSSGWERSVRVRDVPAGYRPALVEQPPATATPAADSPGWSWRVGSVRLTLGLAGTGVPLPPLKGSRLIPMLPTPDGGFSGDVRLSVE